MSSAQKGIKIGAICLAIFIIVNIFAGIMYAVSLVSDFSYIGEDDNKSEYVNSTNQYYDIKNIDVDMSFASFTIRKGEKFSVDTNGVKNQFSVRVVGNKLEVVENKHGFRRNNKSNVVISVPDVVLDSLDIDTGAGKVLISGVNATSFDMDHGAGLLEIMDCSFKKAVIDGGAGKFYVSSSSFGNLDLEAGVGSTIINARIEGISVIECGVGKIDIDLIGKKEDYSIKVSKGIGSINIDGVQSKNDTVYGNGSNYIEVDGGVGSIDIKFSDDVLNR